MHWKLANVIAAIAAITLASSVGIATASPQTRDEKVRIDRETLKKDAAWYYDDLASGLEAAAEANKPLMVVLRCIP